MKTRDSYSKAIYFWREAASACRPQLISHWQSFNSRPCCKVLGWTIQRARARCSRCVSVEHQFCGCWPNNFHVAEIEITVGMFHFNQLVSGLKGEGACWIEHPRPFLTPEVGKGPSSACSQRRQKLRRKFGHSMTKLKGVFLHITAWQTQNVISESYPYLVSDLAMATNTANWGALAPAHGASDQGSDAASTQDPAVLSVPWIQDDR